MWRAVAMIVVFALPLWAEAPETSIHPQPRPDIAAEPAPEATAPDPDLAAAAVDAALAAVAEAAPEGAAAPEAAPTTRPRARPETETASTAGAAAPEPAAAPVPAAAPAPRGGGFLAGLFGSPRPRPDRTAATPRGNGICGNPALTGAALDPIRSRTNGCGLDQPVQITAVDGITLSMAATMDCTTANALSQWVDQGLRPAFAGQEIAGLQVAAHYICRTRNNQRGARISEHGRGRAIDISGIIMGDGSILTVAGNWNRAMRSAYQAGCGIFGTTLGPGSDGYHEDHMHFDTANHRNGPYCR